MAISSDIVSRLHFALASPSAGEEIAAALNSGVVGNTFTFSGATGTNTLAIPTNLANALSVVVGATPYLTFTTTTGSPAVVVAQTLSLADGTDVGVGEVTGSMFGTDAAQKLSFYGASPVVQRSGASQAAVATTPATSTSPFGYAEAQANAIVTLVNELRAALVALGLIAGA